MSYLRQESRTMQKCKKIMSLFNQVSHSKNVQKGTFKYTRKPSIHMPSNKNISGTPIDNKQNRHSQSRFDSIKKSKSKSKSILRQSSQYNSVFRDKSNSSFVSSYKKQSRLDQIMKLKVKSIYKKNYANSKGNKSLLNSSINSLNSSRSSLNKQNVRSNKDSRLDKIMNIKVQKPNVSSTLINYEPRKGEKSKKKPQKTSSILQLKECKKKMRKSVQIEEKQDRVWKLFQRQRDIRQKSKKKQLDRSYKEERRKQERFEKLVAKELKKIENSKQINLRKSAGFSEYVYPSY